MPTTFSFLVRLDITAESPLEAYQRIADIAQRADLPDGFVTESVSVDEEEIDLEKMVEEFLASRHPIALEHMIDDVIDDDGQNK